MRVNVHNCELTFFMGYSVLKELLFSYCYNFFIFGGVLFIREGEANKFHKTGSLMKFCNIIISLKVTRLAIHLVNFLSINSLFGV